MPAFGKAAHITLFMYIEQEILVSRVEYESMCWYVFITILTKVSIKTKTVINLSRYSDA